MGECNAAMTRMFQVIHSQEHNDNHQHQLSHREQQQQNSLGEQHMGLRAEEGEQWSNGIGGEGLDSDEVEVKMENGADNSGSGSGSGSRSGSGSGSGSGSE